VGDSDCVSDLCNQNYCTDPICNPDDFNDCQGCLQQNCCANVVECYDDPGCVCWFNCIEHNNDFMPCQDMCNVGGVGLITSCANSECNFEGACALP
jgi:hypothetical protein